MDFIAFKKYLNKNNIKLFDSEYRIVYHRFNNLSVFTEQTGGKSEEYYNIIAKMSQNKLNCFINSLLQKNIPRINWILTNI